MPKAPSKKNAFQQNLLHSSLIATVNEKFQAQDTLIQNDNDDGTPLSEENSQDIRLHNESVSGEIVILTHAKFKEYFEPLDLVQPQEILLYDADLDLIRSIEVYQSYYPGIIQVHFMMYEESIEEYRYMNTIQNEKKYFEQLNKMNTNLVIRYFPSFSQYSLLS